MILKIYLKIRKLQINNSMVTGKMFAKIVQTIFLILYIIASIKISVSVKKKNCTYNKLDQYKFKSKNFKPKII